ncbi:MAG: hypothetical protein SNJ64_02075, partial [Endomicrobiia bacterium]
GLKAIKTFSVNNDFDEIIDGIKKHSQGVVAISSEPQIAEVQNGIFVLPQGQKMDEYAKRIAQALSDYLTGKELSKDKISVRVWNVGGNTINIANDFANVLKSNGLNVSEEEYQIGVIVAEKEIYFITPEGEIVDFKLLNAVEFISSSVPFYLYDKTETFKTSRWTQKLPQPKDYKETFRWGEVTPLPLRILVFGIFLLSTALLISLAVFPIISGINLPTREIAHYLLTFVLRLPWIIDLFASMLTLFFVSFIRYYVLRMIRYKYYTKGVSLPLDKRLPEIRTLGRDKIEIPRQYRFVKRRVDGILAVHPKMSSMPKWLAAIVFTDDVTRSRFESNYMITEAQYGRSVVTMGRGAIIMRVLLEPIVMILSTWRALETLFSRGGLLLEREVEANTFSAQLPKEILGEDEPQVLGEDEPQVLGKYEPRVYTFEMSQTTLKSGVVKVGQYEVKLNLPQGSHLLTRYEDILKGERALILMNKKINNDEITDLRGDGSVYIRDAQRSTDEYDVWVELNAYVLSPYLYSRTVPSEHKKLQYYTLREVAKTNFSEVPMFIRTPKVNPEIESEEEPQQNKTLFRFINPVIDLALLLLGAIFSVKILLNAPLGMMMVTLFALLQNSIATGNYGLLQMVVPAIGMSLLTLGLVYFISQVATNFLAYAFSSTAIWRHKHLSRRVNLLIEKLAGPAISLLSFRLANQFLQEAEGLWSKYKMQQQLESFMDSLIGEADDAESVSLSIAHLHNLTVARIDQINGPVTVPQEFRDLGTIFYDNSSLEDIKSDLVGPQGTQQGYIYRLANMVNSLARYYDMDTDIANSLPEKFIPLIYQAESIDEIKSIVTDMFVDVFGELSDVIEHSVGMLDRQGARLLENVDSNQIDDAKVAILQHSEVMEQILGVDFTESMNNVQKAQDWNQLEAAIIQYAREIETVFPMRIGEVPLSSRVGNILARGDGTQTVVTAFRLIDSSVRDWMYIGSDETEMKKLELSNFRKVSDSVTTENIVEINAKLISLLERFNVVIKRNSFEGIDTSNGKMLESAIKSTALDISKSIPGDDKIYDKIYKQLVQRENFPGTVDEIEIYENLLSEVINYLNAKISGVDVDPELLKYINRGNVIGAVNYHKGIISDKLDEKDFSNSEKILKSASNWQGIKIGLIEYAKDIEKSLGAPNDELSNTIEAFLIKKQGAISSEDLTKIFKIIDKYIDDKTNPELQIKNFMQYSNSTMDMVSINSEFVELLEFFGITGVTDPFAGKVITEDNLRKEILPAFAQQIDNALSERGIITRGEIVAKVDSDLKDINWSGMVDDEILIYRLMVSEVIDILRKNIATEQETDPRLQGLTDRVFLNISDASYEAYISGMNGINSYLTNLFGMFGKDVAIRFSPSGRTVHDLSEDTQEYFKGIYSILGIETDKMHKRFEEVKTIHDLERAVVITLAEIEDGFGITYLHSEYTMLPIRLQLGKVTSDVDSLNSSVEMLEKLLSHYAGGNIDLKISELRAAQDVKQMRSFVLTVANEVVPVLDSIIEGRLRGSFEQEIFVKNLEQRLNRAKTVDDVVEIYNRYVIREIQDRLDSSIESYIKLELGGYNPYGGNDFQTQIADDAGHIYDNLVFLGHAPTISREQFILEAGSYFYDDRHNPINPNSEPVLFKEQMQLFAKQFLWKYLTPAIESSGVRYDSSRLIDSLIETRDLPTEEIKKIEANVSAYNKIMSKVTEIFKNYITVAGDKDLLPVLKSFDGINDMSSLGSYIESTNVRLADVLVRLGLNNDVIAPIRTMSIDTSKSITGEDVYLWAEKLDGILSTQLSDSSYTDGSLISIVSGVKSSDEIAKIKPVVEQIITLVNTALAKEAQLRARENPENPFSRSLKELSSNAGSLALGPAVANESKLKMKIVPKSIIASFGKILWSSIKSVLNIAIMSIPIVGWVLFLLSLPKVVLQLMIFMATHDWVPFNKNHGLIKELQQSRKLGITPSPMNGFTSIVSLSTKGTKDTTFAVVDSVANKLPKTVQRFAKNLALQEAKFNYITNKNTFLKIITLPIQIPLVLNALANTSALIVTISEIIKEKIGYVDKPKQTDKKRTQPSIFKRIMLALGVLVMTVGLLQGIINFRNSYDSRLAPTTPVAV